MSPKTWMRKVYFQRYLKLEKLARLGVGYLTLHKLINYGHINLFLFHVPQSYNYLFEKLHNAAARWSLIDPIK